MPRHVKAAAEVLNLTNSEVTAPVYDDGLAVGALEVEKVDAPNAGSRSRSRKRSTRPSAGTPPGDSMREQSSTTRSSSNG
jgi:hypothetical protein